jgi:hypothetical protein
MGKRADKVIQMPKPLTESEWEQLVRETFAERKQDLGRDPDRRRPKVPTWYPPGNEPPNEPPKDA